MSGVRRYTLCPASTAGPIIMTESTSSVKEHFSAHAAYLARHSYETQASFFCQHFASDISERIIHVRKSAPFSPNVKHRNIRSIRSSPTQLNFEIVIYGGVILAVGNTLFHSWTTVLYLSGSCCNAKFWNCPRKFIHRIVPHAPIFSVHLILAVIRWLTLNRLYQQ